MKLIIGSSAPPDRGAGISAYATDISEAFVSMGIEVHYVSPTPDNWQWFKDQHIKQVSTNSNDDQVQTAERLLSYIHEHKIDGIINNDNPALQSIAPSVRCPVIVVGHMDRRSIATLACWRSEWSDYVVAISYDMQRKYVLNYGVPVTKCPVILNGVRDPGHDGYFANRDSKVLRVIYAGGHSRNKGWNRILSALKQEENVWRGIKLEWYGHVPRHVKKRLSRFSCVHYHGPVPREDFLTALRMADVFLLPSKQEGCPMAMLEAMSFGVVPIASDGSGAMRWLITSGPEGFICNLNRWVEQMTLCLTFLRDHPKVLSDMKEAVRNRYLSEFDSSVVAAKLLKLILRPTVVRNKIPKEVPILRWHRPLRSDGKKAPLLDRLYIRLGVLRTAGVLTAAD